ncbi:MAG: FAD/NAD(P)-binding oxidoreductase, partial [Hafnia sp.]
TGLVNPRACHETELVLTATEKPKRLAVVGAGPAGLAFATTAAQRGHHVTLFDADNQIGGQFNIAKQIPGKEEFHETLRYFKRLLIIHNIQQRLGQRVEAADLSEFDEVILATGIVPRHLDLPGSDMPHVLSYTQVLRDKLPVGKRVAIIGAGGIGFDTAEYLSQFGQSTSLNSAAFAEEWGIDLQLKQRGGLAKDGMHPTHSPRKIYLLQRKTSKVGEGLGKTTGWIHRVSLQKRGVIMINGAQYHHIDEHGLHLIRDGQIECLPVDNVIICAGQESQQALLAPLQNMGKTVHLIGGADVARELDARRAIDQGTRLALTI